MAKRQRVFGRLKLNRALRTQRGVTLLEMTIVVALTAIAASLFVGFSMSSQTGSISGTRYALYSAMTLASSEAMGNSTGNGATLVVTVAGGETKLEVYDGRPNGGGMSAAPMHSIRAPLAITATGQNSTTQSTPIAIFVDSFGQATYENWTPGTANPSSMPVCSPSGASLVVAIGTSGQTMKLENCAATLSAYDGAGSPLPQPTP